MANWPRLGTVFVVVGFEIFLFALATTGSYKVDVIAGLLITAFILYLIVFILMVFIYFGGFESTKVPSIIITITAFLAGLLILIAVIVYSVKYDKNPPVYPTTLFVSGSLMAILGSLVSLLSMMNVLK